MPVDLSAYPKGFSLEEGQQITVRPLQPEDEQELLRFMSSLPAAERIYFRDNVTDPELIHRWTHAIDVGKTIALVGLFAGRIIANWTLHYGDHGWTRHNAFLRGEVAPEWRHKGIGTRIIRELLTVADGIGLERVIIELVKPQQDLVKRYTRIGFTIEATLKDWVKDFNDRYHDLLILSMKFEPAWKKMESMIMDYGTHGG